MLFDLPADQLPMYESSLAEPADFDDFWSATLAEARAFAPMVRCEPVDAGLTTIDVYDVRFRGFAGEAIAAWLRIPRGAAGPLPAVIHLHGYGLGRGEAFGNLLWASAGYAHFEMDSRGQAYAGARGVTPDTGTTGPHVPGFATRGIGAKETYYTGGCSPTPCGRWTRSAPSTSSTRIAWRSSGRARAGPSPSRWRAWRRG